MSLSNYFAKKIAGAVADMVEDALTGDKDEDDKDKDKDDKDGGFLSFFKGDKKEKEEDDDDKLFSFGGGKKKDDDDDDKGGFFSKVFKRDDDDDDEDKGKEKKSGFAGLFSEQAAGGADPSEDGEGHGRETGDQDSGIMDGDLLSDLMEVADETSKGN